MSSPRLCQQRIADQLALSYSVCNLGLKEGLETKYKRMLRLEEKVMANGFKLTEAQIKLLEKANPDSLPSAM